MAHELSIRRDGTVEAAFAGQVPWHRLGTVVPDRMAPAAALAAAHLEWEILQRPLELIAPDGERVPVPDRVANVRSGSGAYLGVVSRSWVPVQNREQADFLDALTGEGGAMVECVGALFGGRRTFWTVRMPGDVAVTEADPVRRYLILCNGHDGSLAFRAFWSPIRVVCNNTLNAALRDVRDSFICFHMGDVKGRIAEARQVLGLADIYFQRLGDSFRTMLARWMSDADFKVFLDDVFPIDADATELKKTLRGRSVEQVARNFGAGRGAQLAGRTAWGAYNAVTEYLDHQRPQPAAGDAQARRFASILSGDYRVIQQRAFNRALAFADPQAA